MKSQRKMFPQEIDDTLLFASSSLCHGNMSLSYGDQAGVLDNRKRFLDSYGIDYRSLVCLKQAHGSRIRYATEQDKGKGALSYDTAIDSADAIITDRRDLPLAVFTADCLPVFLYDPRSPAIAIVHAGWRGTAASIAAETVALMWEKFNTQPDKVYATFGPAIRSCCYEVGEDFCGIFSDSVNKRGGRYYLDLARVNKRQLIRSGLKETNIFDSSLCTCCGSGEYFSYRRQGKSCGRQMSAIALK